MKQVEFIGEIQDGKLHIRHRADFDSDIKQMGNCVVMGRIDRLGSRRTLPQNAYLWGIVYKYIGEHCGYSVEEVHEICKQKFLSRNYFLTDKAGEIIEELTAPGSTKRLTKSTFAEYVDKCIALAAELGITIPSPNEYFDDSQTA